MNILKWKDTSFKIGDIVKIDYKIKEGEKERSQSYQGTVIRMRGAGDTKTFTVRKIAVDAVGVERIFPLNSPWIINLKVVGKIKRSPRRSKLYFLRQKKSK